MRRVDVADHEEREKLIDEVDRLRREHPGLERQLEQYRSDRVAYERVRGDRAPAAPAPAPGGRTTTAMRRPKSAVGRIR